MPTEGRQPLSIPLFAHTFKEAHAAEVQECLENLKRVASEGAIFLLREWTLSVPVYAKPESE